jgi:hypothetical protein
VAHSTVLFWVSRAGTLRLDRVDFADRPCGSRKAANRTTGRVEQRILDLRAQLKHSSDLGEFGAVAIHRELTSSGSLPIPSVRTIGRILERYGALDYRRRVRRPAPPMGWYLPEVARQQVELDSFDFIEGLSLRGGPPLDVLTAISLHGRWPGAWPLAPGHGARSALEALVDHWREFGLPGYAQFDNDTRFVGPRQHANSVGRVIRACMTLQVIPVFAPPRESSGFQAAVESFNGRWQAKVWCRFEHPTLGHLRDRSRRYIEASRLRALQLHEQAPVRRPVPKRWILDLQAPPRGRIIFLRRTTERGHVDLFGHDFRVDRHWVHRLVRCEVDLGAERIQFYGLRRKAPTEQPLLGSVTYALPRRPFRE